MRKFAILLILIPFLAFSTLLENIPQEASAVFYVSDAVKLYKTFKSLSLGKVLMEDLGLEAMITSMTEAYGVDAETLSQIKEILVVTRGVNDTLAALGPFEDPESVSYVLQSLIPPDANVEIGTYKGYVVLYTSDDIFSAFTKGGGKFPDDPIYSRSGVVALGHSNIEGYEERSVVYVTQSSIEAEGRIIGKESPDFLKPFKKLSFEDLPAGDLLLVFNALDLRKIAKILNDLNVESEEKIDVEKIPKSGFAVLGADVNELIAKVIEDSLQGATQTEVEELPKFYGKAVFSEKVKLTDEDFKDCEKLSRNSYKCEDVKIKLSGNEIEFESEKGNPQGKAKEIFKELHTGKEFFVLAWDMSGILEPLGLELTSYMMGKAWVEGNEVRFHGQLK